MKLTRLGGFADFVHKNKLTAWLVSGPLCIAFPIVYEWGHKDQIKPIEVSIALHPPFFCGQQFYILPWKWTVAVPLNGTD